MKPRIGQRTSAAEQATSSARAKTETLSANGANAQQTAAQARKRRSSINVYDQPSSLNSRLRQLETDMLRLDEDRNRLVDETHAALAQYELKLSEIHAIIKSRQDNVERYVEDMRMLLQAKEDFEKQAKSLNEKHDRIHEKFMHRETIISREIKLLKNKFEILEKNRQFRGMLQKSTLNSGDISNTPTDDLNSGLEGSTEGTGRKRSETGTTLTSELDPFGAGGSGGGSDKRQLGGTSPSSGGGGGGGKSVRIKMSNFSGLGQMFRPLFRFNSRRRSGGAPRRGRRKSNKVSSISNPSDKEASEELKALANVAAANGNHLILDPAAVIQADTQETGSALNTVTNADDGELSSQLLNTSAAKIKSKKPSIFGRLFRGS